MKIDQEEERQYSQILSWIALKIKSFSFISSSLLYTQPFLERCVTTLKTAV